MVADHSIPDVAQESHIPARNCGHIEERGALDVRGRTEVIQKQAATRQAAVIHADGIAHIGRI